MPLYRTVSLDSGDTQSFAVAYNSATQQGDRTLNTLLELEQQAIALWDADDELCAPFANRSDFINAYIQALLGD